MDSPSKPTPPSSSRPPAFRGSRGGNSFSKGGFRRPNRGGTFDAKKGVTPFRRDSAHAPGGASFDTRASIKTGLSREEGTPRGTSDAHEVQRRGRGSNTKRGPSMGGAFSSAPRTSTFKNEPVRKTGTDKDILSSDTRLRIAVMGGNEEIGRNMTMLEFGNDIILIDMGLQFPDEDMPGVDYIVPNISCLKGKEKNVRGVIITHAHFDHIGGIPHLIPRLGNPPVFATDLTCGIIQKRQEDHRDAPPLNLFAVKSDDILQLGVFKIEFFGVAHSVPSSMGVIVNTPCGIVVHTGDFKLEAGPGGQSIQETEKIKALGERKVLALMADSTNASKPGRQLAEIEIQHNIDEIIKNAKGKIIIGTFASMISRIQQILLACERQNRKVAIEGFSMKSNVMIAQQLGYMVIQKGTLIDSKDVHKYPRENVAVICTGAQGEERAVLMRIANHEHPVIKIEPGDTVVFSSSIIPGNERSVQRVKDTLYREGAEVIHYKMMDVHAGGHAQQDDLKEMHEMVKPKYLIPIEGHYSFLCEHAKIARDNGFNSNNIFIADNGQIMEFDMHGNGMLTNRKVPTDYVFVDGLGVGNTNQIVLRDRQELGDDGVVVAVAVVDGKTGRPEAIPDIISRGFVYMKEHQELINDVRKKADAILREHRPGELNAETGMVLKDKLRDQLGEFIYIKTQQRPMIIPVIIEV